MVYQVVLIHSAEGYSVACPALPGCASQGDTKKVGLENIQSAIAEYEICKNEMLTAAS